MKTKRIRLVRGVCIKNGKILVAYSKKQKHYLLPGGHIESHETARNALERELLEEVGVYIQKVKYSKKFYHSWKDKKGKTCNESILLFYFVISKNYHIRSKEKHLIFKWVEISRLPTTNILPDKISRFLIKKFSV